MPGALRLRVAELPAPGLLAVELPAMGLLVPEAALAAPELPEAVVADVGDVAVVVDPLAVRS